MNLLYVKMAKYLIIFVAVFGFAYLGYDKIYSRGFQAAEKVCIEKENKRIKDVNDRLDILQKGLATIGNDLQYGQTTLSLDINSIMDKLKRNPIIEIKNGQCVPSKVFLDSINQAIDRANKK